MPGSIWNVCLFCSLHGPFVFFQMEFWSCVEETLPGEYMNMIQL